MQADSVIHTSEDSAELSMPREGAAFAFAYVASCSVPNGLVVIEGSHLILAPQ